MATSHERGWPTVFDHAAGCWRYADTGEPAIGARACARCGQEPTAEGYDACLGTIPGVTSACCGHGVTEPIEVKDTEEGA